MEIISNLQKIGKNKVQRTSTCLSPIVEILPFWFYHLLAAFFFTPHLLVSLPSLKSPLLWFISVATVVFYGIDMTCFWRMQSSVSSPPLFNRMFILGFLVRFRLCVLVRIPHWWYYVVRFRAYRVHLLFVGDVHLVIGSRWCSVCPMYSLCFFLPCI